MNGEMLEFIYARVCEKDFVKNNTAYDKANRKNKEIYEELINTLKGEELKLFEKFVDSYIDVECEACEIYYKSGLKFGAQMIVDLLYEN